MPLPDVRFAPKSRHWCARSWCPFCADFVAKVRWDGLRTV